MCSTSFRRLDILVTPPYSMRILFFFNDPATTDIYTLSLHDALPICFVFLHQLCGVAVMHCYLMRILAVEIVVARGDLLRDRKSTRLNSSHSQISYAVFCLKKKK